MDVTEISRERDREIISGVEEWTILYAKFYILYILVKIKIEIKLLNSFRYKHITKQKDYLK